MYRLILLISLLSFSSSLLAQNPSFLPWENPEAIFARAKKENKPVFMEAYLPTCSHCMAYDVTLKTPAIKTFLRANFLAYQIDLSKRELGLFLRKQKIYIPSTPAFIVFSPNGEVLNIETMGDATNSVEGIKKSLSQALDMQKNNAGTLQNYLAGKNPANLVDIAYFTRMRLDTVQNMRIVNDITKSMAPTHYTDESSLLFIQKVMLDTENPLFDFFIQHLPAYKAKYDTVLVRQAAENTLMSTLFSSRARSFSPERIAQIKTGLAAIGLGEKQIAQRCIVLEVLIDLDKKDITSASTRIQRFYGDQMIPEKEKEFWCKQLSKTGLPCPLP